MELVDFLRQTQGEVRAQIEERTDARGTQYPYAESVFAEVVMQHMADVGMTFDEPVPCHFERTVARAHLRLSGYALSEDSDQMDLFVCLYSGTEELQVISDMEVKDEAHRCVSFLKRCVDGRLSRQLDSTDEAYAFVVTVEDCYEKLDQIRVFVLTDRQAKAKRFKPQQIGGKTIMLEVMDIERLHRHWSEGKPRDELVLNFEEVCGSALPCVYVKGEKAEYDYALTALPGEALRFVYERYGARLLEANVRSFLSVTGKVNRGIRDTLVREPERFMAYNNGIVVVADEAELGKAPDGSPGLLWLKGVQIVNGGQTTASLYFTKKKTPEADLKSVRVAAKVLVLRKLDPDGEEKLIAEISRFANSQNAVKVSDLSANKPFHVALEQLSNSVYCPDGVGRWFYERAAGSYHVMLTREAATPARLRSLRAAIPPARKITKTDLAKFLNAWDCKPHFVGLGSQKNFERFMAGLSGQDDAAPPPLPDAAAYKLMIAKAIVYKTAQRLIRPTFPAFQANIVAYTVALLADRLADRLDLQTIWDKQEVSAELGAQIVAWAKEVNRVLTDTAGGRMLSEWAKKPECWDAVRATAFSAPARIPEVGLNAGG